jgi:O-succinylbenzoic acid--CoA ligase
MNDWLSLRAQASPDKLALIFDGQFWSYSELNQMAQNIARQLLARGVKTRTHVAVLSPNSPDYVVLIHALMRIGAVLVPLNTRLTNTELAWQIEQSDCEFLVYAPNYRTRVEGITMPNKISFSELNEPADKLPLVSLFELENTQSIIFTSGTTGESKGAMLSCANHFWSATASAYRLGVMPDDRWLACMPLYHVGGLSILLRSCLYGTAVVLHDGFSPEAIAHSIDTDDVTLISLVPTMLDRLLDTAIPQLGKLRFVLLGGGAASKALLERALQNGVTVVTTYGMSETASQVATSTPEGMARKVESVGKPLMFIRVRIEDRAGQLLSPGEIGEIVVSGPMVMQGYYRRPDATRDVLRDGRLYTGDIGYLDEDGDLWIVQRRVDLIVSGGENVYPSEVENVLARHPAIKESVVVGVGDSQWGQVVAAGIVLNSETSLSKQEIIDYCRESLAGYKIPRYVAFFKKFPRTASGKIQRNSVREQIQHRLFSNKF